MSNLGRTLAMIFLKNKNRVALYAYLFIGIAMLLAEQAYALTVEENLEGIAFSLFAPAWIWQGQNINILCTLENRSGIKADVSVRLYLPEGKEYHFAVPDEREKEASKGYIQRAITLAPEQKKRIAFTNIRAKSGVPLQEYSFLIRLSVNGKDKNIPYRVKTIRGASKGRRMWPFLAIIAASCVAFALVLSHFSEKNAWKKSFQNVQSPDEVEDWIKEEEQ